MDLVSNHSFFRMGTVRAGSLSRPARQTEVRSEGGMGLASGFSTQASKRLRASAVTLL